MSLHIDKIRNLDLTASASRRPLPGGNTYPVTRTAGAFKGTLGNWLTSRLMRQSEPTERTAIATRAQDLAANDAHATSIIDSMDVNIVGTGLVPQSQPNRKILGWTEEEAKDFQEQAEWAFSIWAKEADARGRLPFWAMQLLSVHSMLVNGEFFRVPVMLDKPHRTFSLALQCIDPLRVQTPGDKTDDSHIRDGVVLDRLGAPIAYWVACPTRDDAAFSSFSSFDFRRVPARVGHRPGMLHCFFQKEDEQYRGVSILAPAMKFFRDLSDYLDFELVGAIVAASFPVFIETQSAYDTALGHRPAVPGEKKEEKTEYGEFSPGGVYYGNTNEKPHILKSDRPGDSFDPFVERILRAVGAAAGQPYEVVAKDFSKTNYSSARAALLEVWRVYSVYQKWLVDQFCQPTWDMVLEEAWLRGKIVLPAGSPDWYDARHAYTRATWIPPKRGHVDPLKEMTAAVLAKEHNILTLAQIIAEQGGDWETTLEQRGREKKAEGENNITAPAVKSVKNSSQSSDDSGQEDEDANSQKAISTLALAMALLKDSDNEEN